MLMTVFFIKIRFVVFIWFISVGNVLPISRNFKIKSHNKFKLSASKPEISPVSAAIAPKIVDAANDWIANEPFENFIPREDLSTALQELNQNQQFWNTNRPTYDKWWLKLEQSARQESRPLRVMLGETATNQVLSTVEELNVYEPGIVRAFLSNSAFENMIGGILYEGIFEFIQKIDLIGNIIDKIPVLGPIRQIVIKEFKTNLDKTLGVQVKSFLVSFNRVAVQRMIEFVLSPSNQKSLQKANRNVVQNILDRPFSSIIPGQSTINAVRDRFWLLLVSTPPNELIELFDSLYDQVSVNSLQSFGDAEDFLDIAPTIRKIIEMNLGRFFDTESGRNLLKDIAIITLKEI